jgi:hypothetical protein
MRTGRNQLPPRCAVQSSTDVRVVGFKVFMLLDVGAGTERFSKTLVTASMRHSRMVDRFLHITELELFDVRPVTVVVVMRGHAIDADFHGAFDTSFVVY